LAFREMTKGPEMRRFQTVELTRSRCLYVRGTTVKLEKCKEKGYREQLNIIVKADR